MSSLYLGNIVHGKAAYEIHVVTNGLPFKSFSTSEISDVDLYHQMLKERFKLLERGEPIYCTAVTPDIENKQEYNPHDDRPGTAHVLALDKEHKRIASSLSVAVDTGEKEHGTLIGLPLENRWRKNDYPQGASLDDFRERYTRLNHNSGNSVEPYEMAELYRHFRTIDNADPCRLGIYTGAYHVLVKEARNRDERETCLWVFDAIQPYFNLYRWAGAAVLRDFTIRTPPRFISPNRNELTYTEGPDGRTRAYRNGEIISRNIRIPKPLRENDALTFRNEELPFLDGLVDIHNIDSAVKLDPSGLEPIRYEGMLEDDMYMLRSVLGLVGRRAFEDHHKNPAISSVNNHFTHSLGVSAMFNEIGR